MAVNVNQPKVKTQPQVQGQQQAASFGTGFVPSFGIKSPFASIGKGGEEFEKLFESIKKKIDYINEHNKDNRFNVVKLIKDQFGLYYSSIILTETYNGITAAHVLVVEKTGDYPQPLIENIGGIRYEIIRTPADAVYEDKYMQAVTKVVSEALKVDEGTITVVDATLVPQEFDYTNENMVQQLLVNASNAVNSELFTRVNDYSGINITEVVNNCRNGKFLINLYFNSDDSNYFDQTGMPVRQDVCVTLSFKTNQANNSRYINQGNDTIEIVRTYGYIDFEWSPTIVNNMMATQKFVPNFVITHMESNEAPTPDILFLGIVSALAVNEDMNWMQAFRPMPARKNEIDFNDIGALNIEGNIENNPIGVGKKYDTKSKTFTLAELNKFIQTLVRPNIMVSIDIPKAGPDTWFMSVLQYIKFRNDQKAYDRVLKYLATLTNGAFNPGVIPMFADITNKIHAGYYRTKDGIKDIRHLSSYLAVANFIADTNQNPALIAQYTNTLYNTSIPAELRAAERKKYIDEMSNKTAVYKQFHDRLTFSAGFLMNLVNSLKLAGFAPVFSNMGAVNDMFARRSSADFTAAMLGMDARILGQQNAYSSWFGMPYGYVRTF